LLPNPFRRMTRKARRSSVCIKRSHAWLILLPLASWCLIGCAPRQRLVSPFVEIKLKCVDLFIEGAGTLEETVTVIEGDLRFVKTENGAAYLAEGRGTFRTHGVICQYSPDHLKCNGEDVDLSLGGAIIRRDGRLERANPLLLLAK
jgi:hypothetical protein